MRSFDDRYPQDAELTHPILNQYGQTQLLNRRFKRLTWLFTVLFVVIFVLLVLELAGVVPISPFQPDLKITGRQKAPSH
jgi:hypothetical protein